MALREYDGLIFFEWRRGETGKEGRDLGDFNFILKRHHFKNIIKKITKFYCKLTFMCLNRHSEAFICGEGSSVGLVF